MPKVFTSKTQRVGEKGEQIASLYLQRKGFSILERNYTKKWGEIDIVAQKGSIVHFVEVKAETVSPERVSRERLDRYRPEEQMHQKKLLRLRRTVSTYLLERRVDRDWQFDLIVVHLNPVLRSAQVEYLENIII
jgi:putative endonuclease